jgi:hypothetical protein
MHDNMKIKLKNLERAVLQHAANTSTTSATPSSFIETSEENFKTSEDTPSSLDHQEAVLVKDILKNVYILGEEKEKYFNLTGRDDLV